MKTFATNCADVIWLKLTHRLLQYHLLGLFIEIISRIRDAFNFALISGDLYANILHNRKYLENVELYCQSKDQKKRKATQCKPHKNSI